MALMCMHISFSWFTVSDGHWSKEKFQNATCTPREIAFGFREEHVPEDGSPSSLALPLSSRATE